MKITRFNVIALVFVAGICAMLPACRTASPGQTSPHASFIDVDTNGILYVAGNQVTPQAVAGTLSLAADIGARYEIKNDGHARDYFVAAKAVIDVAVANGNYDPAALKAAMQTISIKQLANSTETQQTILTVLDTYGQYFNAFAVQKLNGASPYLVPMLEGISDGIGKATAAPPQ